MTELEITIEIGWPFLNIAVGHQWLPHWKCTWPNKLDLIGRMVKIGWKMANG